MEELPRPINHDQKNVPENDKYRPFSMELKPKGLYLFHLRSFGVEEGSQPFCWLPMACAPTWVHSFIILGFEA